MFFEQAAHFLTSITVYTHRSKCRWYRYPASYLYDNPVARMFIKTNEADLGKLDITNSYFVQQDCGFVYFFSFGKKNRMLCIQQAINLPLIEVAQEQNSDIKILETEIVRYIDEEEGQPWGTYNFFSHICPNEPEPTDEEIEELGVSPFEK